MKILKHKQEISIGDLRKLLKEQDDRYYERIKTLTKELEESKEWFTEPYAEEYKGHGPPAPLWPYSPLQQVLDHDPVVTTLIIKLKPT